MKNNKIVAIVKNDVERSIKNKWFIILNVIMLLFTVIGLNFNTLKSILKDNNIAVSVEKTKLIYIEDLQNIASSKIEEKFKSDENVVIGKLESVSEYENENIDSNVILVKVQPDDEEYIKATIETKEAIPEYYIDEITSVINDVKDEMIAKDKNLTNDEVKDIKKEATIDRVLLGTSVKDEDGVISLIQIVSNYLIFFILLLCLNKIANTISQEKMSKSIEYILTSITSKEYMISKVLSTALIVIVQFIFMLAYLLIALMLSSILSFNIPATEASTAINASSIINLNVISYFLITLVFMCLTVFLQGIIQSVMSAKTTNIQEAGNATLMLVILNLILYTVVTALITPAKSATAVSYILSALPIASMYFIPAMFIMGQANIFQIVISLVVLVASIPLSLIFAQTPFRNAILDFAPKKVKNINGIEKILSTREYQERMIERKDSSKKGLVIGMSVILLIIIQVIGGLLTGIVSEPISQKIRFISQDNIYLILSCVVFVISTYLPYLLLKSYNNEDVENKKEITKEEKKKSIIKCIKYIVLSIPIISMIQMICSFAIEKMGLGVNVTDTLGLFNYSGKLATLVLFVQVAVLPAIFEELFIRKGVIGILKSRGAIFATVVSSLVFATIHMNTSQFIFAFLVGILFAIVRLKTGKMYPTMILHMLNNGLAVVQALFYNHITFMQIFTYATIALNAIGFCILVYMIYQKVMELKDKESIQKLKEKLDYRKIKLNLIENLYVFRDFTFLVTAILSVTLFTALDKILSLI